MLGRRLPLFTLLKWQHQHIIVADSVDCTIKVFYFHQRLQFTDNYFFKDKFAFFLYLLPSASWKENAFTPEVQCLTFHQKYVVWQTKITNYWRNGNYSKQAYSINSDMKSRWWLLNVEAIYSVYWWRSKRKQHIKHIDDVLFNLKRYNDYRSQEREQSCIMYVKGYRFFLSFYDLSIRF
jgi:hypothetical protein